MNRLKSGPFQLDPGAYGVTATLSQPASSQLEEEVRAVANELFGQGISFIVFKVTPEASEESRQRLVAHLRLEFDATLGNLNEEGYVDSAILNRKKWEQWQNRQQP